ncbi:unnamed protein product [Rhizophagus irregularis]|uniref:Uncharacterized protein n=1 Tax=Rhizophagus irregularis TaxID=588596 RepID=A0A2I1HPQ6_9GLOM|nr:hypothetical protein RhiirA4_485096 [Rhizophagus irregularis]CAB4431636.1 unnamed protein product [Rhizophagus irregularis]
MSNVASFFRSSKKGSDIRLSSKSHDQQSDLDTPRNDVIDTRHVINFKFTHIENSMTKNEVGIHNYFLLDLAGKDGCIYTNTEFLLNKLKAIERRLALQSNKSTKTCTSIRLSINNVIYHIGFYIGCSLCSAPCHYVMSHERRGCLITHHHIFHQRPCPKWDQPIQMDLCWLHDKHDYQDVYALSIANPNHMDYLGRLPDALFEDPTIQALQDEFNELMEKCNLSHICRIFEAIRYSDKEVKPYVLQERRDYDSSPEPVKKKKKKKKKQNKKTDKSV